MGHNWKTTKLLDHYDIRSGLSKPAKDFGSGYPFLTFKDVFYNYFTPDILGDLVQSNDKERASSSVKRGDVFLTRTSETMHELGMSCVALQDYENSTFNGFCKRLRPHKESELVPEYVGYYLRSPKFRQSMLAFSTMSTRASLNNEMIGRLEISYPSKNEQLKIAKILKTLDDKVALNRQINQTLEQMAQALFKSWFVDFDLVMDNALEAGFFEQERDLSDELLRRAEARKGVRARKDFKPLPAATRQLFPAAFEPCDEPSLGLGGWVPKGWNINKIENLMELVYGKALKSTDRIDGPVPVYGSGGITGYHNESLVDGPSIIVGRKGTVGSLYWEDRPFFPIDTVFYVRSEKPLTYCFYLLQTLGLADMNTDAAVPGLNRNNAYRLQVTTPDEDLLDAFDTLTTTLRKRIFANAEQSTTLINLRDGLLPKLISGELSLDKMESVL
ncbi:restriction endonuclease subunit S [Aeromonas enterica]